jgi:hypothetical protein
MQTNPFKSNVIKSNVIKSNTSRSNYNNTFSNNVNNFTNKKVEKMIDFNNKEEFPSLIMHNRLSECKNVSTNFKDILNFKQIELETKNVHLLPGYVEIVKDKNGVIQYKYNNIYNNVNIHNSFNYVIESMMCKWDNYKKQYDELNGFGAYDDLYYLKPIYNELDEDYYDEEDESELLWTLEDDYDN